MVDASTMTRFFADDNEDILEDIDVPFLMSVSHLMRMKVLVEGPSEWRRVANAVDR